MLTRLDTFMIAFIAIFLTGTLWPSIPHISLSFIAIFIAFPCMLASTFRPYITLSTPIAGALLGFSWVCISANWYLYGQLDRSKIHQQVLIEASVGSIIIEEAPSTQIKFLLKVNRYGVIKSFINPPEILVSWRKPSFQIKQGDVVKLYVSVKDTAGNANPYTFNYQQWLVSRNIVATGSVIESPSNTIVRHSASQRQVLLDKLLGKNAVEGSLFYLPWIAALSLGYRDKLSKQDWTLLQSTGTAHLFSISGMHLALVAAYCAVLGKYVFGLIFSLFRLHNTSMASANLCFVVISSATYAWLSGMEVPVIRALIAVLVLSFLATFQRNWAIRTKFICLLFMFCLLFPYSVLGISFWFSFVAVLLILFYMWRFPVGELSAFKDKCLAFVKLQSFLSLSTIPITFSVFGTISVSAILANLLLVPFVSFIVLPLCVILLVGLMLDVNMPSLFYLVDFLMQMVVTSLGFFDLCLPAVKYSGDVSVVSTLLTFGLGLLILLPIWSPKTISLLGGVSVWLVYLYIFAANEFDISKGAKNVTFNVFDVGHGNASLLRVGESALLFDTGAGKAHEYSHVEQVLQPFLRAKRIKKLKHVFISHFDQDHAGGLFALHQKIDFEQLHTPQQTCVKGNHWEISEDNTTSTEQIFIKALWPLRPSSGNHNNESCVLLIETKNANILLAGDIEKSAEEHLLASGALDKLDINILIAPHHGSRSSSSLAFVQKIRPDFVIFATSNPSRWGHPHSEVVSRYLRVESKILHVGQLGAIEFDLSEPQIKLSTYREHLYNRWYFKSWAALEQ